MLTERFSEFFYFENQTKIGRRPGNLMPRNSVTMAIPLEFKETFPTVRVIHGDDSTGKRPWDNVTTDTVPEKQQKEINHYDTKNNSII